MKKSNDQSLKRKNIIFFDGVCVLCSKSIDFIVRRDKTRKFRFLTLQSELGAKILRCHRESNDATDDLGSVVYLRNGKVKLRSGAVLAILSDLGGVYRLFSIFYLIPFPIRDFAYDQIAKRRYRWFGKREMCCTIPIDNCP